MENQGQEEEEKSTKPGTIPEVPDCQFDPIESPHEFGVRRKLKTLTFCRRRKGIKDTVKKRKSSWAFKFGQKVKEVPELTERGDSCICTVYRRTDQSVSTQDLCSVQSGTVLDNPSASQDEVATCTTLEDVFKEDNFKGAIFKESFRNKCISKSKSCHSLDYPISADPFEFQAPIILEHSSLQLSNLDESAKASEAIAIVDEASPEQSMLLKENPNGSIASPSAYHRCDRNVSMDGASQCKAEQEASTVAETQNPPEMVACGSSDIDSNEIGAQGLESVFAEPVIDLGKFNPDEYPMEDWDERARLQRAKEMEEGVEPPPGYKPKQKPTTQNHELPITELALYLQNHLLLNTNSAAASSQESATRLSRDVLAMLQELTMATFFQPLVHTQVDYIHCLVPDLLEITNCSCYWGKMDRYEAEKLLENKPEGTFLLRDSAQEEFLFSVSFQRYGKTLHARIEQWNHKFSFDSHDPGVFSSGTICGLIEHYKDPCCCMYFDPMLTIPLHRTFPFSLQHLCRAVICNNINYESINCLLLPKSLKSCLKEYHYKQRVKVRRFDF